MTPRAIILGLLGAVTMGAFGQYACKYIPGQWGLVRGHLPTSVFGLLIFFTIVINPLMGKIWKPLRLRASEIAVVLGLILVACGMTEAGMMRYFPRQLITPIQQEKTHPGWQSSKVLDYTPKVLLANDGEDDEAVLEGFYTAMAEPGEVIPITDVPWHAWWKSLSVWTGLLSLFLLANVSLAVLFHRQWADKERIRYPLAEIASSLLRQDEKGKTAIFLNRLFWIGLLIPFTIRILNGIYLWFPESIEIPLSFDFSALKTKFPELMKTPGAGGFANPTIFPACLGIAFLLASDISLSLGLANILTVAVLSILIGVGVDLSGGDIIGGYTSWQAFGSFLAMGVMVIYIGRRYYWQTTKEALTFRPQAETEKAGVWALRVFAVCSVSLVAVLMAVGMDFFVATLTLICMMLMVVVCARMNAECGTFFFSPAWRLPGVLIGIFGLTTLGPKIIIILGMLFFIVQGDIFECLMPFASNALKITSDTKLKVGRTGLLFGAGLLLTIAVAVPSALWADYNHAAALRRGGDGASIWNEAEKNISQLSMAGELEKVTSFTGWDRIANIRPTKKFVVAAGLGFGLLILVSSLRLRYPWWPLHPVIILVFGTRFASRFGFSFFLGWLIKVAVTKFGGGQKYAQVKPLMIGVIVGDLAAGFVMMMVSWIYYGVTGMHGRSMILW